MSIWGQMLFQDPVSFTMSYISDVHDMVMIVVIFILSMVIYLMVSILFSNSWDLLFISSEVMEVIWISIPSIVLVALAFPSLNCLYMMEEVISPSTTWKVVGHQWYWSYEEYCPGYGWESSDSYMKDNLESLDPRLLSCDSSLYSLYNKETRLLVTSADVIHSWTVPALGVKVDAIPGRVNQLGFTPNQVGEFFGQCSEICGTMHSFMPISVKVLV
uniref:Cytochrome c oxidase subunit 2 n=1 Tax=Hoplopleura pacifica TaxID=186217 RepID=M9MTF4_9NEOP|nr:cytochrome c oxidase subunit 2 [Hoplopleura pacifica]